jgi:hypothetical protein
MLGSEVVVTSLARATAFPTCQTQLLHCTMVGTLQSAGNGKTVLASARTDWMGHRRREAHKLGSNLWDVEIFALKFCGKLAVVGRS